MFAGAGSIPPLISIDEAGRAAYHCFLHNAVEPRSNPPLVSVFTPAYRTGERIRRPLRSLLEQSYPDWEWESSMAATVTDRNSERLARLPAGIIQSAASESMPLPA